MLFSQLKGPLFNGKQSIVSKRSLPEPTMSETATEKYEELDDLMVLYTRSVLTLNGLCDVQIHLSKSFLKYTPAGEITKYLDRAVAAILTQNGVSDD